MAKRNLDIIIGAHDRASGVMARVEGRTRRFGATIGRITAAAGIAGGLVGVIQGFRSALTVGIQYEHQLSRIRAITGETRESLEGLEALTKELGSTTQFTAAQAAEAAGNFALAGFSVQEIMDALPATLNLAAAGQLGMAEASDIAAQAVRQMGFEAKDVGMVADVLTAAFTTANTDLRMLGEAFKKVGVTASQSGQSMTVLTAALQALAQRGSTAEEAGTALRNILLRLQTGTEGVSSVLKELGVTIADSSGQLKPLPTLIDEINASMADMTPTQRSARLAILAGTKAARDFTILATTGGDKLREMASALEQSMGRAAEVAAIQMDDMQGAITRLSSAAQGAGIMIKESMDGWLRPLIEGTAQVIGSTTQFVTANGNLSSSFATIAISGGLWLALVWKLNTAIKAGQVAYAAFAVTIRVVAAAQELAMLKFAQASTILGLTRAATLATAAASQVLHATLIGGLVVGLGIVTTAFIKARREGISFGEAILRMASDFGIYENAALKLKDAQGELDRLAKNSAEAQRDLNEASDPAERLQKSQMLVDSLEAEAAARRRVRDIEIANKAAQLREAEEALKFDEARAKSSTLVGDIGARESRERVAALRAELQKLQTDSVTSKVLAQTIEKLNAAKERVADIKSELTTLPDAPRGFAGRFEAGVIKPFDLAKQRIESIGRLMVDLNTHVLQFTSSPMENALRAARMEAELLKDATRASVMAGDLSVEQNLKMQGDIDKELAKKLRDIREQFKGAASDIVNQERIAFLEREAQLGDQAAARELERLRVQEEFNRRRQALVDIIEDEKAAIEDKTRAQDALNRLASQEQRARDGAQRRQDTAVAQGPTLEQSRFLTGVREQTQRDQVTRDILREAKNNNTLTTQVVDVLKQIFNATNKNDIVAAIRSLS